METVIKYFNNKNRCGWCDVIW